MEKSEAHCVCHGEQYGWKWVWWIKESLLEKERRSSLPHLLVPLHLLDLSTLFKNLQRPINREYELKCAGKVKQIVAVLRPHTVVSQFWVWYCREGRKPGILKLGTLSC